MSCNEAKSIIDGYVDGELDLVTSMEVERHIETCESCSSLRESRLMLQESLRSNSLYYHETSELRQRILKSVNSVEVSAPDSRPVVYHRFPQAWLAAAAALIGVALLSWNLGRYSEIQSQDQSLAQQVFSSDVRSLMAVNQGIEIRSSNQHTVKPWFAGKLDFSPDVSDLAAQGYPLIGGRRDYVNEQTVATLIYKRREHVINLFIWPAPGNDQPQSETYRGYHLIHWTQSGMTYWAVSDLNTGELLQFVHLVQRKR